ncbi:MAG TPA: RHS repeat-associated core domain-containing protein [Chthoniobacterales bacterium]
MSLDGPPPLATYSYDTAGTRLGRVLENGTSTAYAYDTANRLISVEHRKAAGVFAKFNYALDSVGNRTAKAATGSGIPNQTESYGYDAIDQIRQAVYGAARTVNYDYDSAGNRTALTDNGLTTSYSTNSLNQYAVVSSVPAPAYSTNGNLTAFNGSTYSYDAQNRLTGTSKATATASFSYDSRNRQVSRTINGVSTWFVYDGWNLIAEYATNGNLLRKYIHGAAVDEILARIDSVGPLYYHQDGLGSTVALTDPNGNVVESYQYDVFGRPAFANGSGQTIAASATGNRFLFAGREWLPELGLYDYRNRIYSPDLGRFLQTDPIGFGGDDANLYRFVGNNPINLIDPNGAAPVVPWGGPYLNSPAALGGAGPAAMSPVGQAVLAFGIGYQIGSTVSTLPVYGGESVSDWLGDWIYDTFMKPQPAGPPMGPPRTPKAPPGFPGDDCEKHHRLPQEFQDWFEASPRNLNIEDFTRDMPMQWHRGQGIGIHSQGYNAAWRSFIEQNPGASGQQTINFLNQVEGQMGFGP